MKIDEVFPNQSDFLKKEDLKRPVKVIIESVEPITFPNNPKPKLRIGLKGKEKDFICNVTNARTIGAIHGDDTDSWIGKEIMLYNDPTVMMGDEVKGGIKVQYQPPATGDIDPDDDIPF